MTMDFGTGGRWRPALRLGGLQVGGLVLMLAGLSTIPGYIILETWMNLESMKRDWAVEGPPCPEVVAPEARMLGKRPLKVFIYGGVRFARKTGHVDCAALPEDRRPWERAENYRVCQFTGPGVVGVTLDGKTRWYVPGWGKPTTVTVRHGGVRCVADGWFRG
ncbi:hypothetical protein [Phenylobacterium sp.]|uniref:hypothetical protein n=1 Tax=Phenylobacterium sp. TaxID=1871053 RepID=UPI002F926758